VLEFLESPGKGYGMSPRFGSRLRQVIQGPRPWPAHIGTWVLVLAAWMILTGCTSRGAMRPPPGDLFSRHRYRPPIPAFLKERTASNTARHTAGVEGGRAMAGPSTGFAPVQEGTTRRAAHHGPGPAEVHGPKPAFRPSPPPPALDAPAEPSAPPRTAPNHRPAVPIQSPAPGTTPLRSPPVTAPQPLTLPMPFWARVAALVLLPGTAHAPGPVPECEKARSHRNEHLAGQRHPVTGVLFKENGYPAFDSFIDIILPEELRGPEVSDTRQFSEASRQVREILERSPETGTSLTPEQVEAIRKGWPRIPGLTWHHHEDGVTLQLVDRDTHARTGHSGGRETSGGRP